MRFGIAIFPTDTTLQPVDLARAVEERGFESLWFPEHSHIPTSRETPWGGVPGAKPLPEYYWRTHDAFVALAAAAAVTTRLRLGTGITLLAQRDYLWTAKEVASLDTISRGRLIFGVGYGWNKEEMAHHGVEYRQRRELLREKLLAMKALWTEEEASFHGELIKLEPSWAWPKPVQQPHPPVLLGAGLGPRTLAHLVELCDGWIPLGRHRAGADEIQQVRSALQEAGRNPDAFDFTYWGPRPGPEVIGGLAAAGFGRVVFTVPPTTPEEVVQRLDQLAALVESL